MTLLSYEISILGREYKLTYFDMSDQQRPVVELNKKTYEKLVGPYSKWIEKITYFDFDAAAATIHL